MMKLVWSPCYYYQNLKKKIKITGSTMPDKYIIPIATSHNNNNNNNYNNDNG